MPDPIAEEGKYLDTKTNTIVTEPPEEGVQLVAKGSPITPHVRDTVARYEQAIEDQGEVETTADTEKGTGGRKAEQPDGGDPSKTVTTTQTSTSTRKGS